jgi:hypothetical protein
MGKNGYKHSLLDGVNKYYNKEFDVIMYKEKKHDHVLIIDKRDVKKQVVYNDLNIAIDNLS